MEYRLNPENGNIYHNILIGANIRSFEAYLEQNIIVVTLHCHGFPQIATKNTTSSHSPLNCINCFSDTDI